MNPVTPNEERLRLAVSLSGMGVLELDYQLDTATADERAAEMFDLPAGVAIPRSQVHDRFHPFDRELIEQNTTDSVRPDGQGQFTMDHRVVRRDGSVRWLNIRKQVSFVDGQPTRGLLAAIDITDRKASEQQTYQSHETFRQVVEDNPFGVYVIDDEFKFLYVSQGATQTFSDIFPLVGRDFAEVIRRTWPEPFATEAIDQFRHTLQTGEPYVAPLLIEQRADRQQVEAYEWKIKRISLPNDRHGVVCYYYDATERQHWEQSLKESNELVHTIAENSTEALIMMDDRGYLIYGNQAWLNMTGYDLDELSSAPLHDLVHHHYPDGRPYPMAECPIDRALPEDSQVRFHEDVFFRKDGTSFEVQCSARPIYRDGKPHSTIIEVRDVTLQNAAKRELVEAKQFLEAALSATGLAVWSWHPETGEVRSPHDVRSLFGMSPDAPLMAKEFVSAIDDDDQERVQKALQDAIESGSFYDEEYRVVHPDGSRHWLHTLGRFVPEIKAFLGVVADVTDRKDIENAMRASESRLRLAAEATGFGTYDYDAIADTLVWSSELFQICGLPSDEQPSQTTVRSILHPDDVAKYDAAVANAHRSDGPELHHEEYRIIRRDGQIRWITDTGRTIRQSSDGDGRVHRVVGTVQDITARKQFEESLQAAKQSAEAANRSRGEFLANMSHEIRTPMAAILGHADILKDHLADPDNLQIVETIRRNGNFLLNIINDILDLSKIDAGKMSIDHQAIRPDAIVGEIRSLMDVRASEKSLPLKIVFKGPIPETIQTDAIRLRQVLLNLVGNAIKFTDEGEVRLVVSFDTPRNLLIFDVIDTGIGIPPDALESLFEPFSQVDNTSTRSVGGTGLGLAICRRLAEALGGTILAESTLGKGSRFTMTLEAIEPGQLIEPNLTAVATTATPRDDIQVSASVLVVDDRRDIRYLAQHFIEKAGGVVSTATNGQEAIEFIESGKTPIDVIVMDMQMPIMDGYDATAELRRRGCKLPIIALTANAMKEDRDECLAAGCTDYTTKPLDSYKLIELISRLA